MKYGDTVFLKESIGWTQYQIVSEHPEYHDTITIKNGVCSRICRKSECLSIHDYTKMRFEEERRDQEPRLRAVIEAFNSGIKNSIKIAEHLKIHHLTARGKLLAAHRLKFIVLPTGKDGHPDPNPKDAPVTTPSNTE